MASCTFFGHRDCTGLDIDALQRAIEKLIEAGVDVFYVGHQGNFDSAVLACLRRLREIHKHISFFVVLAYLPAKNPAYHLYRECSLYPAGLETVPPRFAIERRNRWMLEHADFCLCYITHAWGGAYTFARQAKRKGITVIHIGDVKV